MDSPQPRHFFSSQNYINPITKLCLVRTVNLSKTATTPLYSLFSKAHFQLYLWSWIKWWECICIHLHGE